MSDKPVPPLPAGITQEQLDAISGGDCSSAQINDIIRNLQTNYDNLVAFTSYVFEQVLGPAP